jgi:serine/threonine protein phosphatase 1
MRILAIGDIHGYSEVLGVKPAKDDLLITVGDYVDRGPDARGVIDMLIPLYEGDRLIPLRGNHDVMMTMARKGEPAYSEWLRYGGQDTLKSYGIDPVGGSLSKVPKRHWKFLEEDLHDWYETDGHFFVHAQAHPELPFEDQPLHLLHWEALFEAHPHCSGKVMVCGHTKQKTGLPRNWGYAVCIDTWVYGDGWLTCLDVASGRYWQANHRGELRTSLLRPPEE